MPELKFATIEKFFKLLTDNSWLGIKKDRKVTIIEAIDKARKAGNLLEEQIEKEITNIVNKELNSAGLSEHAILWLKLGDSPKIKLTRQKIKDEVNKYF